MKQLKYIILLAVAIFTATDFCFAQSYSITPNDTVEVAGVMEDLQTLTISQLNTGNDTLYFQWEKVSESVPQNWEASVCDNEVCYTSLMDTGTTNPVFPTESGFILLHITPHVNYGTAIIRYAIWDINYPTTKDTLTFILHVNETSAINRLYRSRYFSITPNPVGNNLTISTDMKSGFQFAITNSSGQKICSENENATDFSISTENIPSGIYIASLSGNNFFLTQRIIIQH